MLPAAPDRLEPQMRTPKSRGRGGGCHGREAGDWALKAWGGRRVGVVVSTQL